MHEYALYILIAAITALLAARKIINHAHIGRNRLLPGPSDKAALPAASEPLVLEALLEEAGIMKIHQSDGKFWARHVIIRGVKHHLGDIQKFEHESRELLGLLMWEERGTCNYCANGMVCIQHVIKKNPPRGSIDLGLVQIKTVGIYCGGCGVFLENSNYTKDPLTLDLQPEPFRTHKNLFEALNALSRDNGRLTKQISLDMLLEESARLRDRSSEVARAIGLLTRELHPSIEDEAYRDNRPLELTEPGSKD